MEENFSIGKSRYKKFWCRRKCPHFKKMHKKFDVWEKFSILKKYVMRKFFLLERSMKNSDAEENFSI